MTFIFWSTGRVKFELWKSPGLYVQKGGKYSFIGVTSANVFILLMIFSHSALTSNVRRGWKSNAGTDGDYTQTHIQSGEAPQPSQGDMWMHKTLTLQNSVCRIKAGKRASQVWRQPKRDSKQWTLEPSALLLPLLLLQPALILRILGKLYD